MDAFLVHADALYLECIVHLFMILVYVKSYIGVCNRVGLCSDVCRAVSATPVVFTSVVFTPVVFTSVVFTSVVFTSDPLFGSTRQETSPLREIPSSSKR